MTADNVTVERLESLIAAMEAAISSMKRVKMDVRFDLMQRTEAAAIVNETITNLTNEAR